MLEFWTCALGVTLLLYVLLDGFDLGVGMLFPFAPSETARRQMLGSIAPVWDGNETWLVISATILFGAFPLVYSVLLSAFYLPLVVMLLALILRGVAFEFRYKAVRMRRVWDAGFVGGSYVASFIQGMTMGALVQEIPLKDRLYTGGPFGWLSPFALLCGAGLCLGYAMLGAGWITYKTEEDVRAFGYRILPRLLAGVLAVLAVTFVYALLLDLRVIHRWTERPVLLIFPAIGLLACCGMVLAIRRKSDLTPFLMGAAIFCAAFATLAISFVPFIIPFSVTLAEAIAPHTSLSFMFWGAGLFALPLTLAYTLVVYIVFKGKVRGPAEYH
ncbi:MAG: cytochrome d ubiquinol oxidase subunit II [Alphaproteobacteria bacterium]